MRNGAEAAYSEDTRRAIDAEVKRLTDEAYMNAKRILQKHEDKLHLLARALIEKETLTGQEVCWRVCLSVFVCLCMCVNVCGLLA